MSMPSVACVAVFALVLGAPWAMAQRPDLGQPISEAEIKAWDITVLPDGSGLPAGSGNSRQGVRVYAEKGCAACHGENASGGTNVALVGKPPLDRIEARKTIANFWANATTLFDIIRRSMPWSQPQTLSNDEVYALTAYILASNNIIGENESMNAETLPNLKMPNRDNFIIRFPEKL